MAHRLEDSIAFSHSEADADYWQEIYRRAFPGLVQTVDLRKNGWHQKAGRDRAIVLSTGRTLYVDEKVRRTDYSDIAVEVWSVYPVSGIAPYQPVDGAVEGWARQLKDCDFLAYAFKPIKTCYLFSYFGIRAAWAKHAKMWIEKAGLGEDGYSWISSENERRNGSRYQTISIGVPIQTLHTCITDAQIISWGA